MNFRLLNPNATLPTQSYQTAAGYDLYATETVVIESGDTRLIPTGIAVEIPVGCAGIIKDRSSYGKQGFTIFGGVIDSDYRGEIFVAMHNASSVALRVASGQKCAQMVVMLIHTSAPVAVDELSETERGSKGFGSTDVSSQ